MAEKQARGGEKSERSIIDVISDIIQKIIINTLYGR